MSEEVSSIPPKGLGSIQLRDFWKSLYYAANMQIIALFGFLLTSLLQDHPHFPTWVEWLPYVKATVFAIFGYLTGKFGVNNVGQIFKADQRVVKVDAVKLDELTDNQKKNS
jgi:hypothetical protein